MANNQVGCVFARAVNVGKIEKVEHLSANPNGQARNFLHSVIAIRPLDQRAPIHILDRPAIHNRIGRRQSLLNRGRRHVQVGAQNKVRLHIDHFVRNTRKGDIGNGVNGQQFASQKGGKLINLGIGKTGGCHGIVDAEHVPKPVIHKWSAGA